jgi:NADPH:quinone reductase-like Zn-dependent oxidoreductase
LKADFFLSPEIDFCGEIAAAGPRVPADISTPGTRVFGNVTVNQMISGGGAMAEYILVDAVAACVRPPPPSLSLAEAAGLSSNGQTALQMLQTAGVKTGHRVFVNGGSTGVGIVLIQALKLAGAYVVATGSGEKANLVKSLGADEVCSAFHVHESKND